ncbi:MAG: hypothetical protein U1F76_03390 [Candidatus Competibacteraceae bacterium]
MSSSAKLPFKTFWDAVEQRLTTCSAEELRTILRLIARETLPSERQAFLDRLQPPPAGTDAGILQAVQQEDLLADIDDLVLELQNEMDNCDEDRYGWQEWDDEDRLGPYVVFVDPLSILFDRTEAVFDQGNLTLARGAYRKLFAVLNLEDDYGRGVRAADLEDVDIDAAIARYLRAVYETEPLPQRPAILFEQLLEVHPWGSGHLPILSDLLDVSPQPLSDQASFLSAWIAWLRTREGYEADTWLREAIRLAYGAAGLAELARNQGLQRPRAYLDWCAVLAQEAQPRQLLEAAQEALRALPPALPIRAAIADYVYQAATTLQQPELLQVARWEAFQAKPALRRLLELWDATPAPQQPQTMRAAADYLRNCLAQPSSYLESLYRQTDDLETPIRVHESALAHAYLLAGDWQAAYELSLPAKVLGWSSSTNPQGLVVAFLLVLLSGKPSGALPDNVRQIWLWNLHNSVSFSDWKLTPEEVSPTERLERIYTTLFPRVTLDIAAQEQVLAWCLETARQRVEAIVSGQHRDSYDKAAVLISACAEVLRLRGNRQDGSLLLAEIRNRFPRHRAFLKELSAASGKGML